MSIFCQFRDITIYWWKICVFRRCYPPQSRFPFDSWYGNWYHVALAIWFVRANYTKMNEIYQKIVQMRVK